MWQVFGKHYIALVDTMAKPSDVARVLKGLKLVIDQVVARNRPEFQEKASRIRYHASELMKVILEYKSSTDTHDYAASSSTKESVSSNTSGSEAHVTVIVPNHVADVSRHMATASSIEPSFIRVNTSTISEPSIASTSSSSSGHVGFNVKTPHAESLIPKIVEVTIDPIGFPQTQEALPSEAAPVTVVNTKAMRARTVPSSQFARMIGFGSLAARMAFGVATEAASRAVIGSESSSRSISDANADRLAEALCRMRGAALKLGQMLSLQDDGMLPPALGRALDRVKQSADYMPHKQLQAQLKANLGADWQQQFQEFNEIPIAAASIGQVHQAKLLDGTDVAVKIQYPGVAESIESDLQNLKRLVDMTGLLPPGLYIDQIIKVANAELKEECKYRFVCIISHICRVMGFV